MHVSGNAALMHSSASKATRLRFIFNQGMCPRVSPSHPPRIMLLDDTLDKCNQHDGTNTETSISLPTSQQTQRYTNTHMHITRTSSKSARSPMLLTLACDKREAEEPQLSRLSATLVVSELHSDTASASAAANTAPRQAHRHVSEFPARIYDTDVCRRG